MSLPIRGGKPININWRSITGIGFRVFNNRTSETSQPNGLKQDSPGQTNSAESGMSDAQGKRQPNLANALKGNAVKDFQAAFCMLCFLICFSSIGLTFRT
jgi:hypothetical protein